MKAGTADSTLFVYGSLLDAAHRAEVLGRTVAATPARIVGYERRRGRHFYLLARAGAETEGLVLSGLEARDFEVLDRYEEVPQLYTRARVSVIGPGGALECWVYLPSAAILE
ncbi:MAG TPA: gamma-glutamylcyclotransferase family protein [Candidatus Binataceae bacterium]|jgi:gamma-glutamylcyclotransferase (GGCT)/AIG2-like uncharacterized protein YtfP|nr:gamma-glutamylcyclotransferase family protein [Candidatus Binataceae bacterium]